MINITEKKIFIMLVVFLSISIALNAQMITRTKVLMGTFVHISTDELNKDYIQKSFELINDIDLSLSSYNKNAQIYKLNHEKKSSLNNYTYEALSLSKKYYKQSDGYFDITIGSITKDLYAFGEEEHLPSIKKLKGAVVNFKGLVFDKNMAYLDENIKVDLGGMGKGYAVDKVAEYLKRNDVKQAVIAASGDIRCLDICKIDVDNPFSDIALLSFTTSKKDMGISTSGNYNRYVKSVKNNHLINPKTKLSQEKFISITLISHMPSSNLDAYATAASVMPIKKAYKFLNNFELAYVVLQSDGELIFSKNFSQYTRNLLSNYAVKK